MAQAKPQAKPAPAAAPPPAPAAAPPPPPPPAAKRGKKVKVRNTGKRTLKLASGSIAVDETGIATQGEYSTLYKSMELV